jgi:hypothetical protein
MVRPPGEHGVEAYLDQRRAPMAGGMIPELVTHIRLGLTWQVIEVLDHWEHPDGMKARGAVVREAWKMRVAGPLPGRPGERGEFVMTARVYSHVGGWWIAPEPGSSPAETGR